LARQLPSLNQLRAFEAAARHESIKKGAEELCVTPTAVGHQIKALERALGVPLFHRKTRKITLTKDGRDLAAQVGGSLDTLEKAVDQVRRPEKTGTIKITVAPFFGNRWLLPRLPDFHARHPGIKIEPNLSFDYVDLAHSGFDAALRYGLGDWDTMTSVLIYRDRVRPVCAPQLVTDRALPLTPVDLLKLPLACAKFWRDDWAVWAEATGINIAQARNLVEYESRAFMFDAALCGNAVILADLRMTAADEAAGRLVHLHPLALDRPQGIYMATSAGRPANPHLTVFTNWLRQEASSVDGPQTV